MTIVTTKFIRKPFLIDGIQVTEENMDEVAVWCKAPIQTTDSGQRYVAVDTKNPLKQRHAQAFVGDWVLYARAGYKVYTPQAFAKSFEEVQVEPPVVMPAVAYAAENGVSPADFVKTR